MHATYAETQRQNCPNSKTMVATTAKLFQDVLRVVARESVQCLDKQTKNVSKIVPERNKMIPNYIQWRTRAIGVAKERSWCGCGWCGGIEQNTH